MHDEGYSAVARRTSNPVRLWSYELLRHAQIWTAIDENETLDRGRIGPVMVPYYSAEHGPGWIDFHGPSREELGRWVYGLHIRLSALVQRS